MSAETSSSDQAQLEKDARKAVWAFLIFNAVLIGLLIAFGFDAEVIAMLSVELAIILLWLVPVFIYQVMFKSVSLRTARLRALASYRYLTNLIPSP